MIAFILIVVIGVAVIIRLATWSVYGGLLKDEDWVPILEKQISQNKSHLNSLDTEILYIGDLPYISNVPPFDILGYYHIKGIGVIPRWSKSHKLIKAEFEKCKQKELEKYK